MKCPYCNNEHSDEAEFCPVTGESLASYKTPVIKCPRCGGYVNSDALYCPSCGLKIESASISDLASSLPTTSLITCPHCGERVPPEAKYCPKCSRALVDNAGAEPSLFKVGKFIRKNYRKLAGIIAIIMIAVLLLIFYPKPWLKPNPSPTSMAGSPKLPVVQQTGSPKSTRETVGLVPSHSFQPPTLENTPTDTISPTNTPTLTEIPRKSCAGAPPIRVEINNMVRVTSVCGDHIFMRIDPVVGTNVEQYLYSGDELTIIDGPRCSNDASFFLVEAPKYNKTGWVAEAEPDSKTYCLELIP